MLSATETAAVLGFLDTLAEAVAALGDDAARPQRERVEDDEAPTRRKRPAPVRRARYAR